MLVLRFVAALLAGSAATAQQHSAPAVAAGAACGCLEPDCAACPRAEDAAGLREEHLAAECSSEEGEAVALLQPALRRPKAEGRGSPHDRAALEQGDRAGVDWRRPCSRTVSSSPSGAEQEVLEDLRLSSAGNKLYRQLFEEPESYLSSLMSSMASGTKSLESDEAIASDESSDNKYNPWGFCPLLSQKERRQAAGTVGGNTMKVVQAFNEFNVWIWSDGETRPINPATDDVLLNNGPVRLFTDLTPSWSDLRSAGLTFALLPTLIATDGGNRTTWFNEAAAKTCWDPSPLACGPMLFKYSQVAPALGDPNQKRGYYTATSPQHEDYFDPEGPLFVDGDRHQSLRQLWENAGLARRYPIDLAAIRSIPRLASCTPPDEATVADYVGPLLMKGLWGNEVSAEAKSAMKVYARYGKFTIFGKDIHRFALGPTGISKKIKSAAANVSAWAKTTRFNDVLMKATEAFAPGSPFFQMKNRLTDDLTTASLFAGLVGTSDLTQKCVLYQLRDPAHEALFKKHPERYVVELMRYDSAVTSVTALLQEETLMNLEGRALHLAVGTPVQLVLATANRDPTQWDGPNTFNPDRKDLSNTLAWNGRVADVEARDLSKAPRHCPGHCLSLKVGTAVCAAMMGSFEELFAAGKILGQGGAIICNNFGTHQEPPIWEPPISFTTTTTRPGPQIPSGEVLVAKRRACGSSDYYVGSFDTVQKCTDAVKAAGGKFFSYGTGTFTGGWCYIEYTSSPSCPEGLNMATYDFYDVPAVPLAEALQGRVNLVEVSLLASADGSTIGSGILTASQFQQQPVVLARRSGKVELMTTDRFCNWEYRLAVHEAATKVDTWEACCDASWGVPNPLGESRRRRSCTPPTALKKVADDPLEQADKPWMLCSVAGEVFVSAPPTYLALPTSQSGAAPCVKAVAAARTTSLREAFNQCPSWIKKLIEAVGSAAEWSYEKQARLIPDGSHNFLIATVLGKDPQSSALDPDVFDLFTTGMFISVVHLQLKGFLGNRDPVWKRIFIPTKQQYLDRYIAFNFIGMPQEDIDGLATEQIPIGTACTIDAICLLDLDDGLTVKANHWEPLLGLVRGNQSNCPGSLKRCTKKEFVRGAYANYTTKDGDKTYPPERDNYAERWLVNGAWADQAETFLAWSGWGSHRLEPVAIDGAAFVFRTTDLSGLKHRPGFGRVGADLYFDSAGVPVMVQTPEGQKLWRSKVDTHTWQYWKFVWRSSAFLKVTLVDHLWATHFTAGNSIAAAAREALPPAHPLRRLLSMFTFGTVKVNNQALHQLLGPNALLQRSTPFQDFLEVARVGRKSIPSLQERFAVFVVAAAKSALPKEIQQTPYFQDGPLLFDALKQLVAGWFSLYSEWCPAGILRDPAMLLFFERVKTWSLFQQHMVTDAEFLGLYGADGKSLRCAGVQMWFTIHFFHVTGYHRHVGQVADTAADPDFAGFSWKAGEAFSRPRQAIQMSLIAATTATKWPKLSEDYSHLAQGIAKSADAAALFKAFRSDMLALKVVIEGRNRGRAIPYRQMHPDEVECSVAV